MKETNKIMKIKTINGGTKRLSSEQKQMSQNIINEIESKKEAAIRLTEFFFTDYLEESEGDVWDANWLTLRTLVELFMLKYFKTTNNSPKVCINLDFEDIFYDDINTLVTLNLIEMGYSIQK